MTKKKDNKTVDPTAQAKKFLAKKKVEVDVGGINFNFSASSKQIFILANDFDLIKGDPEGSFVFMTNSLFELVDQEQEMALSELINDPENPSLRMQLFSMVFPALIGNKVKLGKLKSGLTN